MVIRPACLIFSCPRNDRKLRTLNTLHGRLKSYDISIGGDRYAINVEGTLYMFTRSVFENIWVYRLEKTSEELDRQEKTQISQKLATSGPRNFFALASSENTAIYVCGGFNANTRLKSVMRLSLHTDPKNVKFKPMADMKEARYNASACSASASIYVFGGINDSGWLSSIEILNLKQFASQW